MPSEESNNNITNLPNNRIYRHTLPLTPPSLFAGHRDSRPPGPRPSTPPSGSNSNSNKFDRQPVKPIMPPRPHLGTPTIPSSTKRRGRG
ncbi:hypothetical protein BFW01_g4693 [Lasiodiplodia theobromae]|nr:hypothetical protein BFW01_g4693 [Lasiodiplodia theobromae]